MVKMKRVYILCIAGTLRSYGVECDIDLDFITHSVSSSEDIHVGGMIDAGINLRFNEDLGLFTNVLIDKRCIDDRLPEIGAVYFYNVFDYAGELRVGFDKPSDEYLHAIDKKWFENRLYTYSTQGSRLSKYTRVDDHSTLRITWISPTIKGIKLLCSYIPNSSVCRGKYSYYAKNVVTFGASYDGGLNDKLSFGGSGVLFLGQSYSNDYHHLKSFVIEGYLRYANFTVNNRFVHNGTSTQLLNSDKSDHSYEVNLIYSKNALQVGIGHCVLHRLSDVSKIYNICLEYKFKRCDTYVEIKNIRTASRRWNSFSFGIRKRVRY